MKRTKMWVALAVAVASVGVTSRTEAHGGYRVYRYRPYYRPYYNYRPYYGPIWYGYYGQYPGVWGPGYSFWHGAVRTQVKPRETQVYVDGYYAGTVDDFDGTFQRLYLRPGEHDLELKLEGHRTFRERILAVSGETLKIHHDMEPLRPGEREAPPPTRAVPVPDIRDEVSPPPSGEDRGRDLPPPASRFGTLALRAQPQDADVWIDGERWGRLEGLEEIVIHLPAGPHEVRIRKEGYRDFETEVTIESGRGFPLNVKLAR